MEIDYLYSQRIGVLVVQYLVLVVSVVVDLDLRSGLVLDQFGCSLVETQDSQGLSLAGWKLSLRYPKIPGHVYSLVLGIADIEGGQSGCCLVVEIFLVRP